MPTGCCTWLCTTAGPRCRDGSRRRCWADIAQAQSFGATGVPFVVVDQKFGVSGAQPAEAFGQVLDRAWSESHPSIEMVAMGDADATACGPDGCAV